jgi:beta-mannosidase
MSGPIVQRQDLSQGWLFRALPGGAGEAETAAAASAETGWLEAAVPGTVIQDLLRHGAIPDPHIGCNEEQVQWTAERDWLYRLDFEAPQAAADAAVDLVFEGLDTFAQVWLNGHLVLRTDNMFVPHRVSAAPFLKPGRNRLVLRFDAALRRGREREAIAGKSPLWNGDSSRLHVRKAQYHYGWDWGPVLLTAGPWKPVRLETYRQRIDDLQPFVELTPGLEAARLRLQVKLAGTAGAARQVLRHRLTDPDGLPVATVQVAAEVGAAPVPGAMHEVVHEAAIDVSAPRLWWPNGLGDAALYSLHTELLADGDVIDSATRRIGFRHIELRQEPVAHEAGTSFHFAVNGREIFVGGANWIPDDNLLNRITPARYRQRVQQARDANMVMLRVWAGGIYEDEAFYDACDELGMLVWQDFAFGCGVYPAHEDFCASVQQEAEAAVRRLRHRASLALWCGNNEDYAVAESVNRHGPGRTVADFPARRIYEQLLPSVCERLDPGRPYWPGSPYTPSDDGLAPSAQTTVGDRHTWEIWHGPMVPFQDYQRYEGRFVSEFGLQSHPSLPVLLGALTPEGRFAGSRELEWHNKAGSGTPDGHRRLAVYLADNLVAGPSLPEQVYATQFVQGEAMRYAYQDFRRRWQRPGARAVGGALVWQLNDCWPVTSWAVIDSAGTPKPAWHTIRRALAPLAVSARVRPGLLRACVMNQGPARQGLGLRVHAFSLQGQAVHAYEQTLHAEADRCADIDIALPAFGEPVVVEVQLHEGEETLARDVAWPEPFRHHRLPDARLQIQREATCLRLRVAAPLKGLWLSGEGMAFADNFIDLLPGTELRVAYTGGPSNQISGTALQQRPWTIPHGQNAAQPQLDWPVPDVSSSAVAGAG